MGICRVGHIDHNLIDAVVVVVACRYIEIGMLVAEIGDKLTCRCRRAFAGVHLDFIHGRPDIIGFWIDKGKVDFPVVCLLIAQLGNGLLLPLAGRIHSRGLHILDVSACYGSGYSVSVIVAVSVEQPVLGAVCANLGGIHFRARSQKDGLAPEGLLARPLLMIFQILSACTEAQFIQDIRSG
ncbi:hypothetical protein SDC9_48099 [bioreactor metagenome]|uniref:Uncharacterized protein n=1 Tax=bioreactor metagenome TaxID=1076179 RepID=A0A644WE52_9ZZZZ